MSLLLRPKTHHFPAQLPKSLVLINVHGTSVRRLLPAVPVVEAGLMFNPVIKGAVECSLGAMEGSLDNLLVEAHDGTLKATSKLPIQISGNSTGMKGIYRDVGASKTTEINDISI